VADDLIAQRDRLRTQMFDPLWRTAVEAGGYENTNATTRKRIRQKAKHRTTAWLAAKMQMLAVECDINTFTAEQCRAAWKALQGVTYAEIRAWAKTNERRAA